ncbi:MAG: enoyl-CoA hydratase [Bdellovibrionales bacterium RIFCSPHIGHO2_01_FULL_40_29]|nr:MAG: enoyl-CoA hydratase [Bdellovibrionales bacterium RIFCSPHIGHO2_01_FULL_40_29]OFZ34214.1 MAG: enoyl-CoA hydratase [Bdellovibrionales bacterium RIFCSPHIGHO2_02_FULL_40_15]
MSLSYQTIKLDGAENGIWTLMIHRPEALNALNLQVLNEMSEALRQISEMGFEDVKALIITGAGEKAFVAGADIREMKDLNVDQAMQFAKRGQSILHELSLLKIPVIAAVNGFALGGGCELALGCDFIIASENAKFGLPEVSLGLIPGFGGTVKLTRAIGIRRAREMTMSGEMISAEQALRYGLVNDVVPAAELMATVTKKINLILTRSPLAVARAKQSINESFDLETEKALLNEAEIFSQLFTSEDTQEGTAAFIEKRKPVFKGK